jgi:pyridoxine 4-dehydrogenase
MNGGTYLLGGHRVHRVGFGAMQLPGPRVFGPPLDRQQALDVLRYAVAEGVDHIDTAQFYGPAVANELIHAALYPYPSELVLVSKVGARRDDSGGIHEAQRPEQLREGVLANLVSLQLDQVPVVNLRRHPEAGVPFGEQVAAMVAMRDEGLIGAVGLSNVTTAEYETAKAITEVACVQNAYTWPTDPTRLCGRAGTRRPSHG